MAVVSPGLVQPGRKVPQDLQVLPDQSVSPARLDPMDRLDQQGRQVRLAKLDP